MIGQCSFGGLHYPLLQSSFVIRMHKSVYTAIVPPCRRKVYVRQTEKRREHSRGAPLPRLPPCCRHGRAARTGELLREPTVWPRKNQAGLTPPEFVRGAVPRGIERPATIA